MMAYTHHYRAYARVRKLGQKPSLAIIEVRQEFQKTQLSGLSQSLCSIKDTVFTEFIEETKLNAIRRTGCFRR